MEILNLAIFSTAIAIFANVGAYIYQGWADRRSRLKVALHILLEIWHRASIQELEIVDPVFDRLVKRLSDKIGQPIELDDAQRVGLRLFFKRLVSNVGKDVDKLGSDYDKAISFIAADDPLFAYKIGSANSVARFVYEFDHFGSELIQYATEGDDNLRLTFAPLANLAVKQVSDTVVCDLEGFISTLSEKLGWGMQYKCTSVMEERKKRLRDPMNDDEVKEQLDSMADMMVEEILATTEKLGSANPPSPWYVSLWQRVGSKLRQ